MKITNKIVSYICLIVLFLTIFAVTSNAANWNLFLFTNAGRLELASAPVIVTGDLAGFTFPTKGKGTKLPTFLTTNSAANVLGDLTGKTLSAHVAVQTTSGNPVFVGKYMSDCIAQGGQNLPAAVRFFFSTSSTTYNVQNGIDNPTQYWWSHPGSVNLTSTMNTTITDNFDPSRWSDANGHSGSDPLYNPAFLNAVKNIKQIGVSFAGDCNFDTGVGILSGTGSADFRLISFLAQ